MFAKNDTVRSLVAIQLTGWATVCAPGYLFTVQQVNSDDTLTVARFGPEGRAVVKASEMEQAYQVVNGISYSTRTPPEVIALLETARSTHQRLRLHYGDRDTGRDWLEEHDVEGTIGSSTGLVRVPLLIHNSRSMGGPALLDDAIVKIRTTGQTGRVLWQHPKYHIGKATMRTITPDEHAKFPQLIGYTVAVDVDGQNYAHFHTRHQAQRWLARMGVAMVTG